MTKQHFEFVASLINAASNGVAPQHLATLAAAKFVQDNPRFDVDRYMAACQQSDTGLAMNAYK